MCGGLIKRLLGTPKAFSQRVLQRLTEGNAMLVRVLSKRNGFVKKKSQSFPHVIFNAFSCAASLKGAVSRQSRSFCLIVPITHRQSLWDLK